MSEGGLHMLVNMETARQVFSTLLVGELKHLFPHNALNIISPEQW